MTDRMCPTTVRKACALQSDAEKREAAEPRGKVQCVSHTPKRGTESRSASLKKITDVCRVPKCSILFVPQGLGWYTSATLSIGKGHRCIPPKVTGVPALVTASVCRPSVPTKRDAGRSKGSTGKSTREWALRAGGTRRRVSKITGALCHTSHVAQGLGRYTSVTMDVTAT
jgi:hypothetical protein